MAEGEAQFNPETEQKTNIELDWYPSKETVANFTKKVLENLSSTDRDAYLAIPQSGSIENMLFTLGHNGRGAQDFPRMMEIALPESAFTSESDDFFKTAEVPLPQFYDQLTDTIETYLNEKYRVRGGQENPTAYQAEIDTLRALSVKAPDELLTISFTNNFEGQFTINKMEGNGYSYES